MQAIIFDFDGVIVDSENYWTELDETFFPTIAPGYDDTHAERMMGLGVQGSYAYLCSALGMTLPYAAYLEHLERETQVIYGEKAQLLPGLLPLIAALKERNIPLAIASSSKRSWIDAALRRLDLAGAFVSISSSEDVAGRTKPFPDVYLHAASRLNATPEHCLAIEDSHNGVRAAKAAGMRCIGLRSAHNESQDLSPADVIIHSFHECDDALFHRLS